MLYLKNMKQEQGDLNNKRKTPLKITLKQARGVKGCGLKEHML